VYKELNSKGLAHFIAYANKSIKVVFEDRTIVRMMSGCSIIRILDRQGTELQVNLDHPNYAFSDYQKYIQVSIEFLEWVFLSNEEKQRAEKEQAEQEGII